MFQPDKNTYSRVGESTEVALRVLAEKIGLPGYAAMPQALALLSTQVRTSVAVSTETSLRSPGKLLIFIIKKKYRIKVSKIMII